MSTKSVPILGPYFVLVLGSYSVPILGSYFVPNLGSQMEHFWCENFRANVHI